jgi:hypothetical protein
MTQGHIVKKITYLGLAIEHGTDSVPDDGRYYLTRHGEVINSAPSDTIALAYLEMAEEEILEAEPKLRAGRERINKERAFNDIISARGASRAAARAKQGAKGGKGGRGGV